MYCINIIEVMKIDCRQVYLHETPEIDWFIIYNNFNAHYILILQKVQKGEEGNRRE